MMVIFAHFTRAGMLDFKTLEEAKKAYAAKDYEKAAKLYDEVARSDPKSEKGQTALFDAADALYKAGRYQEALETYRKVTLPRLQHQKWHNIGNCYAHLKKIDKGIEAYEKALKIQDDKETKFNLELLKKLKKQQQKKQNKNKKNKQNRQNQKNQKNDKQNKNDRQQKGDQDKRQNGKNGQKSRNDQKKKGDQKRQNGQKEKQKQKNGQKNKQKSKADSADMQQKRADMRQDPISDMELRKWERMLNRRAVNTLMMPLPTKKSERKRSHDETKPW